MAPSTRSRGVAPPSRVYSSTPTLQQVQFPARRRTVRPAKARNIGSLDEGDGEGEEPKAPTSSAAARALKLKQETLTQLGFVQSSFEEGYEELEVSDSEAGGVEDDDEKEQEKENKRPRSLKEEAEDDDEDQPPVSSVRRRERKSNTTTVQMDKRRRTLGDEPLRQLKESAAKGDEEEEENEDQEQPKRKQLNKRGRQKSRRKTLGDMPTSSRYYTQTLTQFIGRDSHAFRVLDSDDEAELREDVNHQDDGFDAWLINSNGRDMASSSPLKTRQSSIIPQTPTKPTIPTEIPSSSQQVTPLSGILLSRYGAPNLEQQSPSAARIKRLTESGEKKKNKSEEQESAHAGPTPVTETPVRTKRTMLVVEDSYASEALLSTPSKSIPPSLLLLEADRAEQIIEVASSTPGNTPRPKRTQSSPTKGSSVKRVRISSATPVKSSPRKALRTEIPDSEEEDADYTEDEEQVNQETFQAGEETQFIMNEMAVHESTTTTTITSSPPIRRTATTPRAPKPLRTPLTPPRPSTQPFESQRLATAIVQSLPPAAHRTDAILPLSSPTLTSLITGHIISISLPFQLLNTVARLWFWDGREIKYGASVGDATHPASHPNEWQYLLPQVYELNNPLDEAELGLEGILPRQITRCGYIPPSIASGMLWNITRALFPEYDPDETQDEPSPSSLNHEDNDSIIANQPTPSSPVQATKGVNQQREPSPPVVPTRTQGSMTISQQVEAQLRSDMSHSTTQFEPDHILVPSTPEDHGNKKNNKSTPRRPPPIHAINSSTASDEEVTASAEQQQASSSPKPKHKAALSPIRPSQASTASQASTPSPRKPSLEPHHHRPSTPLLPPPPPPPPNFTTTTTTTTDNNNNDVNETTLFPAPPSSSSLTFQDYSAPSPLPAHLLTPHGLLLSLPPSSSQLLSKSQMLPDSLLREDNDDV